MEDIRAFVAIELPGEARSKLAEIQTKLKAAKFNAKWVAPESIHLTLKFLGGVTQGTADSVVEVMKEAAIIAQPFQLEVSGLGVFPNARRVQIIWAGLTGEVDKLLDLQKEIDSGLSRLGFAPEARPFTAHLTIARMRDEASLAERAVANRQVEATKFEAASLRVESISLMRSQLRPHGPIYTRIGSVLLSL